MGMEKLGPTVRELQTAEVIIAEGDGYRQFVVPCADSLSADDVEAGRRLQADLDRDTRRWLREFRARS